MVKFVTKTLQNLLQLFRKLKSMFSQNLLLEEDLEDPVAFEYQRTLRYPGQRGSIDRGSCREVQMIGTGGEAECFLLERKSNKQLVVCKKVYDARCGENRIPVEIVILHHILPPSTRIANLLGFTAYTQWSPELYFEYYGGGDLAGFINAFAFREAKIPEAFIWHALYQLSDALMLLHHGYNLTDCDIQSRNWRQVLHRDIKPANVLLRLPPPGSPKGAYPGLVLADFGLSAFHESNNMIGTPAWQPPETPRQTTKSDIWAVGAIIHALAHGTNEPPLRSMTDEEDSPSCILDFWAKPKSRRVRAIVPEYSSELQNAMKAAMRWNPDKRSGAHDLLERAAGKYEEGTMVRPDPLPDWVYENVGSCGSD